MHDGHDIGLRQATTGVQIVAERTSRRIDEVSRAIHHVILREVDELGGDQHLVDILHNSVSANVSTIVHALRYAIDAAHYEVPVVAAEYARRLAQHNVPLEALIRAYRLGQTEFLRIAFDEARAVETNAAASLVLAQQLMDKNAELRRFPTRLCPSRRYSAAISALRKTGWSRCSAHLLTTIPTLRGCARRSPCI